MCDEKSGSPLALGKNVHGVKGVKNRNYFLITQSKYHLIIQQENEQEARVASLEIFFIGFKHSVEPWEKFLCAMVTEKGGMVKQRGCNH